MFTVIKSITIMFMMLHSHIFSVQIEYNDFYWTDLLTFPLNYENIISESSSNVQFF